MSSTKAWNEGPMWVYGRCWKCWVRWMKQEYWREEAARDNPGA